MSTPSREITDIVDNLSKWVAGVVKERDELRLRLSSLQEKVKTTLAWHRDGVGPDVPVLQERYDNLIKERNELRAERTPLVDVLRQARAAAQIRSDMHERLRGSPTKESWVEDCDNLLTTINQKEEPSE